MFVAYPWYDKLEANLRAVKFWMFLAVNASDIWHIWHTWSQIWHILPHIWHIWPHIWHIWPHIWLQNGICPQQQISTPQWQSIMYPPFPCNDDLKSAPGQCIVKTWDIARWAWVGYVSSLVRCVIPFHEKVINPLFCHFPQIQNNKINVDLMNLWAQISKLRGLYKYSM